MSSLLKVAAKLASPPYSVTFTAHGNSMKPLIRDGQIVTVVKVEHPEKLNQDDVVLARVGQRFYLHKITAVDHKRQRVQIGNHRGHVNGWVSYSNVYGICRL
jgi:phage repressor protein C with HTH and peptisase S24 domain